MTLGTEVGLGQVTLCWMGTLLPQKGDTVAHHFSAHVYCGQTAGWIRIPLGTKVGLGPGDIALDGDAAPPTERGTTTALSKWPLPMEAILRTGRPIWSV